RLQAARAGGCHAFRPGTMTSCSAKSSSASSGSSTIRLASSPPTPTAPHPLGHPPLSARVSDNEAVLLSAYRTIARAVGEGRAITPAAEWLLDNYHLVEAQIREIRQDLPAGFYRQLPKLASGPFVGYPRV